MMDTITDHKFTTQRVLQKLSDGHPRENVTIHMNGPLAQSMEVLNTYGMVDLPMGLQPSQKNILQQSALDAVGLMDRHVVEIVGRLEKDILMIHTLRQSLNDLVATSKDMKTHTAQLLPDNRRALVAFQPQWWELWRHTSLNRLDIHAIEQQVSWLEALQDTIGLMSEKLLFRADDFQSAIHSCNKFQEHLIREREAARFGWRVFDWIDRQAANLEGSSEDLQFDLQKFREERRRFYKEIHHM